MKGFLTFTLAAGVAITTSSVAQAAGATKGVANISKSPAFAQALGTGGTGLALDRVSLTRELDRLSATLNPVDAAELDDSAAPGVTVKTTPVWSF